jgi:hypothetical protein
VETGDVTFRDSPPWSDHIEAYIDPRLFFLVGPDDAWIEVLANPVLQPGTRCPEHPSLPASAEELVKDIRSNPDLAATEPVVERIGGVDALRLDVRAVPGAANCSGDGRLPVVSVSNRAGAWGGVEPAAGGASMSWICRRVCPRAGDLDHRSGCGLRSNDRVGGARARVFRVPHARPMMALWRDVGRVEPG